MQNARQLIYVESNTGNYFRFEVDAINFILDLVDNYIIIESNKIKIIDNTGVIKLETPIIEVENNSFSKEYELTIIGNQIRMVLAGDLALHILNASGKLEPFTFASLKHDGFAIQFELKCF